ncbi:helix-turn-helix domain-containing protein [Photobacterium leiognathi]
MQKNETTTRVDLDVIEQLCDYLDITLGELFETQKDSETD